MSKKNNDPVKKAIDGYSNFLGGVLNSAFNIISPQNGNSKPKPKSKKTDDRDSRNNSGPAYDWD